MHQMGGGPFFYVNPLRAVRCGGLFAAKAKAQKRQGFPSPRSPACDWAIDLSRGNAIPLSSDRRYKYSRIHVLFTKKNRSKAGIWTFYPIMYFTPRGNPFDRECYPETTCFSNQITNLISNTTILRRVSSFFLQMAFAQVPF